MNLNVSVEGWRSTEMNLKGGRLDHLGHALGTNLNITLIAMNATAFKHSHWCKFEVVTSWIRTALDSGNEGRGSKIHRTPAARRCPPAPTPARNHWAPALCGLQLGCSYSWVAATAGLQLQLGCPQGYSWVAATAVVTGLQVPFRRAR
jgi:hypothetical protein